MHYCYEFKFIFHNFHFGYILCINVPLNLNSIECIRELRSGVHIFGIEGKKIKIKKFVHQILRTMKYVTNNVKTKGQVNVNTR